VDEINAPSYGCQSSLTDCGHQERRTSLSVDELRGFTHVLVGARGRCCSRWCPACSPPTQGCGQLVASALAAGGGGAAAAFSSFAGPDAGEADAWLRTELALSSLRI
jgi:hypothetical protein